jgi:DNA-binding response OmpR family regulator
MKDDSMKKILVVEDDRNTCLALTKFLQELGYHVAYVFDGGEALEAFESFRPHLVLLDIRLPTLDGFELLKRFKYFSSDMPIIMTTAECGKTVGQRTIQEGASDFIPKPIDLDRLEEAISTLLIPA